jgi:hypothetical protein
VHARAVRRVVETADQGRQPGDQRREHEDEDGGDREARQGRAVSGQRPQ